MKINNPFLVAEEELVNIMTRAIMPDQVKEALMRADIIRQELFPKFVREKLVDRTINLWNLMKKVNLQTWKNARKAKKTISVTSVSVMKDDRALFARFLVVTLSRPEIDLRESIGEYEFAVCPRSLFTLDGSL